jgi:hypothetical protein
MELTIRSKEADKQSHRLTGWPHGLTGKSHGLMGRPHRLTGRSHGLRSGSHRLRSGSHRPTELPHRLTSGSHRLMGGPIGWQTGPTSWQGGPMGWQAGPTDWRDGHLEKQTWQNITPEQGVELTPSTHPRYPPNHRARGNLVIQGHATLYLSITISVNWTGPLYYWATKEPDNVFFSFFLFLLRF